MVVYSITITSCTKKKIFSASISFLLASAHIIISQGPFCRHAFGVFLFFAGSISSCVKREGFPSLQYKYKALSQRGAEEKA